MLKYLLCTLIGIILFLIFNNLDKFSIGIPIFDYNFVNTIYTERINIIQKNIEHLTNMLAVRHNVGARGRFTTRIIDPEYNKQLEFLRNRLREIQRYNILPEDATNEQIEELYVILFNDYIQYMNDYCAVNHRIG